MYQRLPYARAEEEGEDEDEGGRRMGDSSGGQMVKTVRAVIKCVSKGELQECDLHHHEWRAGGGVSIQLKMSAFVLELH